MIGQPTVFVIGAGASVPYGLPVGRGLLDKALKVAGVPQLLKGGSYGGTIAALIGHALHVRMERVREFAERLGGSDLESIDALLEKHPDDDEFQKIGKAFIAAAMGPLLVRVQHQPGLNQQSEEQDWVRLVWNKMQSGASTFDAFRSGNHVHFITFNFDKIIEEKLSQAIAHSYPAVGLDDAAEFVRGIVDHVHGTLARPGRIEEIDEKWIANAVGLIRVVHQPSDDALIATRRARLKDSEVVCFLGFGYHEENIRKLGFEGLTRSGSGTRFREMYGTGYGLGSGERDEVKAAFTGGWSFQPGDGREDCHAFLKSHHVLRR